MPNSDTQTCLLRTAARNVYLVCRTWSEDDDATSTSFAQLDRATGRPRWTVRVKGEQDVVGPARRLTGAPGNDQGQVGDEPSDLALSRTERATGIEPA